MSTSVAELFAPFGSAVPDAGVIVAVFDRLPVAPAAIVPVTENVAVPPTGRLTVALMFPVPLAVPQVPPLAPVQVHVTPESVPGSVSATAAAFITDGPLLEAVIVYVTCCPGIADVWPSVLVIARSPVGVSVSVSVAELLAPFTSVTPAGTVTVAVFASVPVAEADNVPFSVNVAVAPTGRLTADVEMFPEPEAGHEPPPAPTHVQLTPDTVPGTTSDTVAPVTADGPAFDTTIV